MSEVADRYRRLAARFSEVVAAVPEDRWDRPSPCPEWSARDVLAHVVETQAAFLARFPFSPPSNDPLPDDPRAAWSRVREAVQAALDDPERAGAEYQGRFGSSTFADAIDRFYALDLLVHGWDIARAAGLTELERMPPEEMRRAFAEVRGLGDALRQSGAFGPEVETAETADEQDRFLAFLGRRP